jgi:hypothetical protein
MLPNERFALACRAWYEEQGLIVDESNGEFAHCPLPKRYGDKGYYLLHPHHQQQGLLQSKDIGECCFFAGYVKRWLQTCDSFPDNYFELWDIYEEYTKAHAKKAGEVSNSKKNQDGKSVNAVKGGKRCHEEKNEDGKSLHSLKLHREKDEKGRSKLAVKAAKESVKKLHEEKDERGKSKNAVKGSKKAHEEKNEEGKSKHAVMVGNKIHEEKTEKGKSKHGIKVAEIMNNQVWKSTIDGFISNAGVVAQHNRKNGWDPNARVKVS